MILYDGMLCPPVPPLHSIIVKGGGGGASKARAIECLGKKSHFCLRMHMYVYKEPRKHFCRCLQMRVHAPCPRDDLMPESIILYADKKIIVQIKPTIADGGKQKQTRPKFHRMHR